MKGVWGWVLGSVAALLLLFFVPMQCRVIHAGTRGIVLTWGQVDKVWEEGIHFKRPFSQRVVRVDVRVVKAQAEAGAASRDLQEVKTEGALNYHLDPLRVGELYTRVGRSYEQTVIVPAVQEVTKATTAKFTAEELITRRQEVKEAIRHGLSERLAPFGIMVDEYAIVNFDFSDQFNAAIEAKQVAAQEALRAQQVLERIKIEAEQKVATANADARSMLLKAEAEAKALALQRQVLTPDLIKLRAIETWDGKLPTYVGGQGPLPFIDIR